MLIAIYSICGFVTISCLIGIIVLVKFWRSHSDPRYVEEKSALNSSNTSTIDYEELLSVYLAYKSSSPEHYDTLFANLKSSEKEVFRQVFVSVLQNAEKNKQKQQPEQDSPLVTG